MALLCRKESLTVETQYNTIMSNLLLLIFLVYCFAAWIHAVATYDWNQFDKDQEQAIKDFF
jgi:hypothetical protein